MINGFSLGTRKVAIVGVGFVGSSIAYALTIRNLAREIVLIDIAADRALGEALDIMHGIPNMGAANVYVGDYSDCKDCDLIIITAGRNRVPGETRLQLIEDNSKIMRNVVDNIQKYYTRGVILVVSNPVDILTKRCSDWMGFSDRRVFGTGCVLDASRLVREIANYVNLKTEVVKSFVVGEHGDGQIAIWSRTTIAGIPIQEYCDEVGLAWNAQLERDIAAKVKEAGAAIIAAKGRTHYGIATCVCQIAESILNQQLTILSVSSVLKGEYGINNVALSVPSIIGVNGVERILEERWSEEEYKTFKDVSEKIKATMNA